MRYRILEPIGKGGMGEVFLAHDTDLERKVALKFLPEALQNDATALARLRREAKAAAALDHPYVCKVYEVGETDDGRAFIAMEYVQGETVARLVARDRLPLKQALRVLVEIAEALDKAHQGGIVHRDLKPANVMLGRDGHIKVMDFGLARGISTDVTDSEAQTLSGGIAGTPGYMSPEQLRGDAMDGRSYLFAFGVVLQELLTGTHPFRKDSVAATMAAILKESPTGCDALPAVLRPLVKQLLSKTPDDRPSHDQVRSELQRLVERPELLEARGASDRVFVGRESDLAELESLAQRLRSGKGSLALVGGEPGVGKTRLCEEILAFAHDEGFLALEGHCYEREGAPPFIPWVESLEHASRVLGKESFRRSLGDAASEIAKLMPELRRVYDDIPEPIELPPEQQRRYLFNGVYEVVKRLSADTPIVWLLDDLHWADESSLLLVEHLAPHLERLPILFLGTYRDVELEVGKPFEKVLAQLVRQRIGQRIALKRLSEDSVAQLLMAFSGSEPPRGFVDAIYHETEGNPFFVEEVFQHLSEEGKLFESDGSWKSDVRVDELEVPEGIRLVIGRRLERLTASTPRVLMDAAVIGRQFAVNILERVCGDDPDAFYDAIEEAETAKLIEPVSAGRETRYQFSHELIRHTLLSSLSLPKRQRVSVKVADALEKVYEGHLEEHAADLAHHLYEAGAAADAGRTIRFLRMAGESALAAAAADEAFYYFDTALSMEVEDERQKADLLFLRGNTYRGRGHWEKPLTDWSQAFDLYEAVGDVEGIGRVVSEMTIRLAWMNRWRELPEIADRGLRAIGNTPTRERALLLAASGAGLAQGRGRYFEGAELLADAEKLSTELSDEALLGAVLIQKVYTDWGFIQFPGKYDAACRASDLFRSAGLTWPLADMLSSTQIAAFSLGRLDEVARIAEELEPLARRLDQWSAQLLYLQAMGPRELLVTGDTRLFHKFGEEHLALCEKVGFPWTHLSYDFMGLADFLRGRRSDALKKLENACDVEMPGLFAGIAQGSLFQVRAFFGEAEAGASFREEWLPKLGEPSGIGSWRYLTGAVQAFSYLGEDDEAAKLYPLTTQAIDTGTIMLHYGCFDLFEKIAGIAATAARDWPAAAAHFENALKQAEAIPHKLDQCEVRYWYGKMLAERSASGDRERARELLSDAIKGYRSIGMPLHLEMAEELRAKL